MATAEIPNDNTVSPDNYFNDVIEKFNKFDKNHEMYHVLCKNMLILMETHTAAIHVRNVNDLMRSMPSNQCYDPSAIGIPVSTNRLMCIGMRNINLPVQQPVSAATAIPQQNATPPDAKQPPKKRVRTI